MSKWGWVMLDLAGLAAAVYLAFWGVSDSFRTLGAIGAAVNFIDFRRDLARAC